MNGAIADPLANTMSAPNTKMITIRGRSQNFFRSLRKPHKSFRKSMIYDPLLLVSASVWSLKVPADKDVVPLKHNRILARLENSQVQGVLTNQPAQNADRGHDEKENDGQQNLWNDLSQQSRKPQPHHGDGPEYLRENHVHDVERNRNN